MTDLVERLGRGCNCGKCKMDLCCCHTMEEAKDRIEQLQAEVKTALRREAETTARYDAKIDALAAEIARKDEALRFAYSWLDRWATHIGMCQGGQVCMCGLTRLRFDITAALGRGR